jgi:ribulose-phosphate 3-epimerase
MKRPGDVILSPSLLSSDFGRLGAELAALEEAGISWAHWDVMDGVFVPNITLGAPVVAACRKASGLFFDVHLMIEEPGRHLADFARAGADLLCVHAESCRHLDRVVAQISDLGVKAAVALNPHTPLGVLEYLLPRLDMVLVMSVNPGFGGQSFIPSSLGKVRALREMIDARGLGTLIQVDGGVGLDNARELVLAGADVLVSGSAFFKHSPYGESHARFQKACAGGG